MGDPRDIDPRLLFVAWSASFMKNLRPGGVWREDSWHFIMVELDKRVVQLRDVDLLAFWQYYELARMAALYLRDCPDRLLQLELNERLLRETTMVVNHATMLPFSAEEQALLNHLVERCRALIA